MGAGEIARLARIDDGGRQIHALQDKNKVHVVATSGLQHDENDDELTQCVRQSGNTLGLIADKFDALRKEDIEI